MSTPIAGSSPTPNDHPAPHLSLELNAGDDDFAWLNIVEHEGVEKIADVCVECWQSAGPEAKKKMFALFAIAGIFIAVCQHGNLLAICDMICSGELLSKLNPFLDPN
jgi:hypothetical protein